MKLDYRINQSPRLIGRLGKKRGKNSAKYKEKWVLDNFDNLPLKIGMHNLVLIVYLQLFLLFLFCFWLVGQMEV